MLAQAKQEKEEEEQFSFLSQKHLETFWTFLRDSRPNKIGQKNFPTKKKIEKKVGNFFSAEISRAIFSNKSWLSD